MFLFILVQDMDDMDADLFGSKKKPSSAPAQTKAFGSSVPKTNPSKSESLLRRGGAGILVHYVFTHKSFSLSFASLVALMFPTVVLIRLSCVSPLYSELTFEEKKPSSAPASTAHGHKKFSFTGK